MASRLVYVSIVVLLHAALANALVCHVTGDTLQTCATDTSVCTSFTYSGTTFQGCMEKFAASGASNCLTITSLDSKACCCSFDKCNTREDCGIGSNEDEIPTPPPTFNARDEDRYCAVPASYVGQSFPCDFGSNPSGWTYINGITIVPNIKGCVRVSDFEPFENSQLGPSDLWCPTALNVNNVYEYGMEDWGPCECSPCRINPVADPSGIATQGLCDFGPGDTWTYIAENGTIFTGLSQCVRVGDYPPIGHIDMGVSDDTLWCPGNLDGSSAYNMSDTEQAQSWGVCECAKDYVTSPPTPAEVPKSFISTADGRYCEIQSSTPAPLQNGPCNFGTTGEWNYFGSDELLEEGIVGCIPVAQDLYPPLFETSEQEGMNEETLWCPGPEGLNELNIYNFTDTSTARSWGVCDCATCRIIPGEGDTNAGLKSGLCGFNREDSSWTYVGEDGVPRAAVDCLTIGEFPPFNASSSLPPTTLWCPGATGVSNGFVYDIAHEALRSHWGLCECLQTEAPVTIEYEDTEVPSVAPTPTTTKSPTLLPSRAPSTLSPTASPFSFNTVCTIVDVPVNKTASKGSGCGFGSGAWRYRDAQSVLSGPMTGCVSIRQFRPLGAVGLDDSLMWCPGGQGGLDSEGVYSPNSSPDPLNWGLCQCDNCQIITIDDDGEPLVGFVASGPCVFGENRTWFYEPQEQTGLRPISGCALISEFPPFPYTTDTAQSFPPGTRWCPAEFGLTPEGVYSFTGSRSSPLSWGLCGCEETFPPTPPTVPPTSAPTNPGETRSPSQSPVPRPTTWRPTKSPVTLQPTVPESCCYLVPGGQVNEGECDFGPTGEWSYSSLGSVTQKLTGCVPVDQYLPYNGGGFRDQEKYWCATKQPAGLVLGDTYIYDNQETRSNWGLCECPCYPTPAPSSKAPTSPPTPLERLAVFIQTDHSGSIRSANPLCRNLTNGASTCWDLTVNFVEHLIGNLTEQLGGPDKLRVHISAFSCVNNNPTSKVVSNGLTKAGDAKAVQNAIKKLRNLGAGRMHGTCPSKGVNQILIQQRYLGPIWPSAYIIVTDGRVQLSDERRYKNSVKKMKTLMKERQGQDNICAATIGFSDLKEINRLMRTDCVFSAENFIEAASIPFSSSVASAMLFTTPAPTTFEIRDSDPDDDGEGGGGGRLPVDDSSTSTGFSDSSTAVVIGTSFVVAGLLMLAGVFLLVKRRSKRRYIPKPHRSAEETFWVNNPMQKQTPSLPKDAPAGPGAQAPRRRSRTSSDFAFFDNLPPAPPLPEDATEGETNTILLAAARPSSPSLFDRVRRQQSEDGSTSPSTQSPSLLDRARKTLSGFSAKPSPQMSPLSSSPTKSLRAGSEALTVKVLQDDVEHGRSKFTRRLDLEEDVHNTAAGGTPAKRPHMSSHSSSS